MQISSAMRWHSSERIAARVLEEMGFSIIETNRRIYINGAEVGEIDIVAQDRDGNLWAVEVKAGKLDVTGVRQAYVNAVIAGMKPMVICKGFADDAAKQLAEKLGVKVVQLSDIFLVEDEELELVVREAVEDALVNFFELVFGQPQTLRPDQVQVLEAVATSQNLNEAAEKLGMELSTVIKRIEEMKSQGILPRWAKKFSALKRAAQLVLQRHKLQSMVSELEDLINTMKNLVPQLQQLVHHVKSASSNIDRMVKSLRSAEDLLQVISRCRDLLLTQIPQESSTMQTETRSTEMSTEQTIDTDSARERSS